MRPQRITIAGLRSFRAERVIDFTDLGLVAIVGDTGAGKSSILEAMVYALYNGTTWSLQPGALIADGMNTMKVAFEFAAEGEGWQVVRSMSRRAYPPSIHKLECLSDKTREPVDGESAVNAEIRRLVGLDYGGFCSAVLLPQGRFERLLVATPKERTAVLKNIFRLDELDKLREAASRRHADLQLIVGGFRGRRASLEADPKKAAQEAEKERKASAQTLKRLSDARTKHQDLGKRADQASRRLEELGELEEDLDRHPIPAEALDDLARRFTDLEKAAGDLDDKEKSERETVDRYGSMIKQADAKGEGKAALEAASARLQQLMEQLPELDSSEDDVASESRRRRTDAAELSKSDAEERSLVAKRDEAQRARSAAEEAATAAQRLVDQARAALTTYALAAKTDASVAASVKIRTGDLAKAQKRVSVMSDTRDKARRARDQARSHLEAIHRADAAAYAAVGLAPGEPCPICKSTLPDHFHPPELAGAEAVEEELKTAEAALSEAQGSLGVATGTLEAAQEALKEAETARSEAAASLSEASAAVVAIIKDADLTRPAATLLAPLETAAKTGKNALSDAGQVSQEHERALVAFSAKLEGRRTALKEATSQLDRRRKELEHTKKRLETDRTLIPTRFRPPAKAREFAKFETALAASLDEATSWLEAREQSSERLEEIGRAQTQNRTARKALDTPHQTAHDELTAAQRTLTEASRRLGLEVAKALKLGSATEDAAAAKTLLRRLAAITQALSRERKEKAKELERHEKAAADLLAGQGVEDADALEREYMAAYGEERERRVRVQALKAQIPVAEELDRRLGPLSVLENALAALAREMTDGRFIGFAVARRQRALLATASEILGRMTGERYGFADNFQIVDRLTGQPRSARTLSGGESFLASLALALGLVEMAARGGGRLEALFLDEGFGTLDADALDDALGELERRAASGRLVGVISHLSAVAERIETVLRVDRTPEGSDVRLVDQSGRQELVERDLGDGLLV